MQSLGNQLLSIGQAVKLFVGSLEFVVDLAFYLPTFLSAAVIVFLMVYVIRFLLLK